jgi:bifunctional non-homologous end joining protein LigD
MSAGKQELIFVVHDHHASTHHHDLRLEKAGVLKSWAVPKGLLMDKGTKHLALETEDHPIEYANFEGEIEEGQYGAGTVVIWDKGTYELEEWNNKAIVFRLHGERLSGRYRLQQFPRAGKRHWLLFRL